jgi:hypothetical protein
LDSTKSNSIVKIMRFYSTSIEPASYMYVKISDFSFCTPVDCKKGLLPGMAHFTR